jgi:hypothetical protein
MKYNVKYEVKDVDRVIDSGLSSFNTETEMDCANLKVTLREWFNLHTGSTTTSEVIELNGKPLEDTDIVPFSYSSLRYKLIIKTPSSLMKETRQQSVNPQ